MNFTRRHRPFELYVVIILSWSPCGATNVSEVVADRCRFKKIDGVSMRITGDGGDVIYDNIHENHPVGTQVAQLAINGLHNDIELRQHTGNKFVRFRPVHRDLLLIVPLDLNEEEDEIITLAISCDTMNISVRMRITLLVIDLNNHRPKFTHNVYNVNISEMTAVGDTVFQVSATDSDLINTAFCYSVVPSNPSSYFTMNATDGRLMLRAPLDYETITSFSLSLVVRDAHRSIIGRPDPHWWDLASLLVFVTDEDDMAPQFQGTTYYRARVTAATPIGTELKVRPPVIASDGDTSLDVPVEYALISEGGNELDPVFGINNTTGDITLQRSITGSEGDVRFRMLMAAQVNNPDMRTYALLRASITGQNKHHPVFDKHSVEVWVMEGQPTGLYILSFSATDNDTASELTYHLRRAAKTCLTYFHIDSSADILRTARPLDFEEHEVHSVTVTVSDGLYEDTLHVMVHVIDVNEHTPIFERPTYQFNVTTTESHGGVRIGQLHAYDGDRNATLDMALRDAPSMITIDADGVLSVGPGWQSLVGVHNFAAVVSDGSGATKRQNMSLVCVRISNEAPPDLTTAGLLSLVVPRTLVAGGSIIVFINVMVCLMQSQRPTPSSTVDNSRPRLDAKYVDRFTKRNRRPSSNVTAWLQTSLQQFAQLTPDSGASHNTSLAGDVDSVTYSNASRANRTASGRTDISIKVDASDARLEPIDGANINIVLCGVPNVNSVGTNDAENGNPVGVSISTVANTVGDAIQVTIPALTDNADVTEGAHAGDTNVVGQPKHFTYDHSISNALRTTPNV